VADTRADITAVENVPYAIGQALVTWSGPSQFALRICCSTEAAR